MTKKMSPDQIGVIVVSAFAGAFASTWLEKFLSLKFPWNILLIMLGAVAMFFILYGFWRGEINSYPPFFRRVYVSVA